MHWYRKVVLENYANFHGRARREEYWMFTLINVLIQIALGIVWVIVSGSDTNVLGALYSLAVLIPALAVSVRRLHDTDRSGWWLLLALIPIIGALVVLYFFVLDSTPGTNKFGENPKGVLATAGTEAAVPTQSTTPPQADELKQEG